MKQLLLDLAEIIDAYRLFPRLFMLSYIVMLSDVTAWFTRLETPSSTQQLFINVMWGAATVITGFYVATGRKWS